MALNGNNFDRGSELKFFFIVYVTIITTFSIILLIAALFSVVNQYKDNSLNLNISVTFYAILNDSNL